LFVGKKSTFVGQDSKLAQLPCRILHAAWLETDEEMVQK